MTGFDRMVFDKLNWAGVYGYWFAIFGVGNFLAYGAHLFMNREQYLYHFSYQTYPKKMFKAVKSLFGSEYLANIIWTAPSLILLNLYL